MRAAFTLWLMVIAAPLWAQAQDPVADARAASVALRQAHIYLETADTADDRIAALTEAIRAYENGLNAMRDGLRSATIRERVIQLAFDSQREQLSRLLGVLQALERASTPLLLIHPTGPAGTARSGMMMSEVTPALQAEAENLRVQLEELAGLRMLQETAEQDLRLGLAGVQEARAALSKAITDRTDLPRRVADDPVRAQILADNAQSLDAFAGSIQALPVDLTGDIPVPFADLQGTLSLPAEGTILRRYNEADAAGIARPGLLIATRPLSLITAPAPGTVRYAGAFLDYGNVLILEPDADFLLIYAGLDQVFGQVGQILETGDPIGLLGGNQPAAQEFLIEASEGGGALAQETLYMELRIQGKPIDPSLWFAKTSG